MSKMKGFSIHVVDKQTEMGLHEVEWHLRVKSALRQVKKTNQDIHNLVAEADEVSATVQQIYTKVHEIRK